MSKITPSHRFRRYIRNRDSSFHPRNKSYKWWLLGNIMVGTFMAVLDATIVNVGLPKIMASFGVGMDKIEWVLTAYMLAQAVMLPTCGWFADRFGYKRMYFIGLLLFTVGSLFCGFSTDENMLILARVVQGLGAGAIQPIGMAIITREFPPHQRGVALGFWGIAAAASVSFGPLIGGYLVDNFSWQLIFDVNVPVGILGLLATIVIQQEYKNKKIRHFDLTGFISVSIFLPVLLYALTEGTAATNAEGWHAPYILVCFAISIIALAIFITAELSTDDPLIDLRLLWNRNFGISNLVMLIFSIGMFGSTFLLPLYLQNTLGYTAIQAGAVFLPIGIIQGFMSPVSGKLADKMNPIVLVLTGILLLALSFHLSGLFSFLTERSYIMTTLYIRGVGMGLIFTPLSTVSLLKIPPVKMAQASSITNVIRQIGGSLGVAILSTMLTTRTAYHGQMFSRDLDAHSTTYINVANRMVHAFEYQAGSTPATATKQSQSMIAAQVNKEAYIQGIDDDFLIASAITLLGGIPVLLLQVRKKQVPIKKLKYEQSAI